MKRISSRNYKWLRLVLSSFYQRIKRFYRNHLHYEVRGEVFYVRLLLLLTGILFTLAIPAEAGLPVMNQETPYNDS